MSPSSLSANQKSSSSSDSPVLATNSISSYSVVYNVFFFHIVFDNFVDISADTGPTTVKLKIMFCELEIVMIKK
jgi:hypothetical protein